MIYQVIIEVLLHFRCFETYKWWLYYRLNAFNFTGEIFYNHSSLVVSVNDAEYNYFYQTFQLAPAPSYH